MKKILFSFKDDPVYSMIFKDQKFVGFSDSIEGSEEDASFEHLVVQLSNMQAYLSKLKNDEFEAKWCEMHALFKEWFWNLKHGNRNALFIHGMGCMMNNICLTPNSTEFNS